MNKINSLKSLATAIMMMASIAATKAQICDTLVQVNKGYKTGLIDMRPGAFNAQLANQISREAFDSVIDDLGIVIDSSDSVMTIDTTTLKYDSFTPEQQAEWDELITICTQSALDDIQLGNLKDRARDLLTEIIFRSYEEGNHGLTRIIPIADGTVNGKKVAAITRRVYNHEDYQELRDKVINEEFTRENISTFNLGKLYNRLAITYYNFGEKYDNQVALGADQQAIDDYRGKTFVHETGNNTFGLEDSPLGNNDYMDPVSGPNSVQLYKNDNNGEGFTDIHRAQINEQLQTQGVAETTQETTIDYTIDEAARTALETKLDTIQSGETVVLSAADLALYTYTDCAGEQVDAHPSIQLEVPSPHTATQVGETREITAGTISGVETIIVTVATTMDTSTDTDQPSPTLHEIQLESVISGTTSTADLIKGTMDVYPSPAIDHITLEGEGLSGYRLYDMTGQLALDGVCDAPQTSIDVSTLPAGMYIVQGYSHDGHISNTQIIKQ